MNRQRPKINHVTTYKHYIVLLINWQSQELVEALVKEEEPSSITDDSSLGEFRACRELLYLENM